MRITLGQALGRLIARRRRERVLSSIPIDPPLQVPEEPEVAFEPPPRPSDAVVFGVPLKGRISSAFGPRIHPISKVPKLHAGIDIAGPRGAPVHAAAAGKVSFSGTKGGYGLTVVLDHGNGFESLYAHMDSIGVHKGQRVEAGAQIGVVGATGRVTGPHLHWEVRRNGELVDPGVYL